MATVVTEGLLRELAGFRARNGCAISIYVDFDPSAVPTIPDEKTKFRATVQEAEKKAERRAVERGRDCRLALEADFRRIKDWGDDEFDRDGARALAVFASSADDLFRVVPLLAPAEGWEIGPELWIAPLAAQLGQGEGALVAVVSRERGVVYELRDGRLHEVADESEAVPGQHEQGGWSQARYERHIENIVLRHLKSVGDEIDRNLRGGRRLHMVVVAPEEMRGEFESKLSHEARESIVGWTQAEAHANASEILEVVRPLLDEAQAREDQAMLERWESERGRNNRAAAGWKQTLDAASDARVDVLLVAESAQHAAWSCPECGRASADGGKCPLDGTKLERRDDAADLAIHQTVLHGGTVVRLGAGALTDADGIGAILRF
ncbi:MAG: Vms1/Ankzf1 family peptidyl-tRNA hydrolase [Gaiellaceae bacterium]